MDDHGVALARGAERPANGFRACGAAGHRHDLRRRLRVDAEPARAPLVGMLGHRDHDPLDAGRPPQGVQAPLVQRPAGELDQRLGTAGAQTLVFTYNVRWDGDTPNVANRGITQFSAPFKAVGPTTDAGAVTAVWTTTEATP